MHRSYRVHNHIPGTTEQYVQDICEHWGRILVNLSHKIVYKKEEDYGVLVWFVTVRLKNEYIFDALFNAYRDLSCDSLINLIMHENQSGFIRFRIKPETEVEKNSLNHDMELIYAKLPQALENIIRKKAEERINRPSWQPSFYYTQPIIPEMIDREYPDEIMSSVHNCLRLLEDTSRYEDKNRILSDLATNIFSDTNRNENQNNTARCFIS